jgi:hypothetical protein
MGGIVTAVTLVFVQVIAIIISVIDHSRSLSATKRRVPTRMQNRGAHHASEDKRGHLMCSKLPPLR